MICTAAVIFALASIAPCEFDVRYRPGDTATYGPRFVVHFDTPAAVSAKCNELLGQTGQTIWGCTMWRDKEGLTATEPAYPFIPAGASCAVWTVPIAAILQHELRHCREGAWHP